MLLAIQVIWDQSRSLRSERRRECCWEFGRDVNRDRLPAERGCSGRVAPFRTGRSCEGWSQWQMPHVAANSPL